MMCMTGFKDVVVNHIDELFKFLSWDLTEEVFIINVESKIEEKIEVGTVYNEDDLRHDKVKISPKIIENKENLLWHFLNLSR